MQTHLIDTIAHENRHMEDFDNLSHFKDNPKRAISLGLIIGSSLALRLGALNEASNVWSNLHISGSLDHLISNSTIYPIVQGIGMATVWLAEQIIPALATLYLEYQVNPMGIVSRIAARTVWKNILWKDLYQSITTNFVAYN